MNRLMESYLRLDALPTLFCPGCGNGIVQNAAIRAIDSLGIPQRYCMCQRDRLLILDPLLLQSGRHAYYTRQSAGIRPGIEAVPVRIKKCSYLPETATAWRSAAIICCMPANGMLTSR